MQGFLLVALFAACVAVCMAEVGVRCTDQSQCGADECCQIINVVIATRKRQLEFLPQPNTSGVCQRFSQEGDSCSSFEVMNGYCGCAAGLGCKSFQVATPPPGPNVFLPPAGLRSMRPGWESHCTAH